MREWLEAQLAAGLPAFAGTTVSGTLAIHQDAVTELLNTFLTTSASTSSAAPSLPLGQAARVIKSTAVRADGGVVRVDFTLAV